MKTSLKWVEKSVETRTELVNTLQELLCKFFVSFYKEINPHLASFRRVQRSRPCFVTSNFVYDIIFLENLVQCLKVLADNQL